MNDTPESPDFHLSTVGGLHILDPMTPAEHEWVGDHIAPSALRFGGGIVVEPRYPPGLQEGAESSGLTIRYL